MGKVTREAFVFLAPKPRDGEDDFAQCGSCRMFVPQVKGLNGSRCIIHGSKKVIEADDSCCFYVDWPTPDGKPNPKVVADHAAELAKDIPGSVTPKESGWVDGRVQCHRCRFAESDVTVCGLFRMLNKEFPDDFDLDDAIVTHSCCNGWDAVTGDSADQDEWFSNRARDVARRRA